MSTQNCANCRHHSVSIVPIPAEDAAEGVDDNMLIAHDAKVFFCKAAEGPHAGQRVGTEPVTCSAHEPPRPLSPELDTLMARYAARTSR